MTENVFITLDLDAFDPSILPATGTPEPGGLLWYETLAFLKEVFAEKNVVGFDIVELCPNGNSKPSEFLAAKLYYKMLSYKFMEVLASDPYDNTFDVEHAKKNNLTKFQDSDE
jgi:agmatinase